MTTPIQNYNALLAAQNYQTPEIKQQKGGAGGQNGTKINPFTPEVLKPEGARVTGGASKHARELNEVSDIGFAKKAGFENGLGGTDHPVDANGRLCKTWIA